MKAYEMLLARGQAMDPQSSEAAQSDPLQDELIDGLEVHA